MFKNFPVIVDTVQKSKLNNIVVNSNDLKTFKLTITINQFNKPIDLTGATVRIAIVKPDNKTVFQDCTITDPITGLCEVVLDTQAFIIAGVYIAEVMIYFGADTVAVTGRFSYSVSKGILDNTTVESTNDWQAINQAIVNAEGILIDLRENGTGIDAQARTDLQTVTTQLAETTLNIGDIPSVGTEELDIASNLKVLRYFVNIKESKFAKLVVNGDWGDAIQAASDYLTSIGGGELFFPIGIYNTTKTIWINSDRVCFRGTGMGSEILYTGAVYNSTNGQNGLAVIGIGRKPGVTTGKTETVSLKSLSINGGLKTLWVIYASYAYSGLNLEDLRVHRAAGFLYLDNCYFATGYKITFAFNTPKKPPEMPLSDWKLVHDNGLFNCIDSNGSEFSSIKATGFGTLEIPEGGGTTETLFSIDGTNITFQDVIIERSWKSYNGVVDSTPSVKYIFRTYDNHIVFNNVYTENLDVSGIFYSQGKKNQGMTVRDLYINHSIISGYVGFIPFGKNISMENIYIINTDMNNNNLIINVTGMDAVLKNPVIWGDPDLSKDINGSLYGDPGKNGKIGMVSTNSKIVSDGNTVPKITEGFNVSTGVDSIGSYVLLKPGRFIDHTGKQQSLGVSDTLGRLIGWILRPSVQTNTSYYVCIDVLGGAFIEGTSSSRSNFYNGKIIIARVTFDGAGIGTVLTYDNTLNGQYTNNGENRLMYVNSVPTVNRWIKGDRAVNLNPTELGNAGAKYIIREWICITSGTPGVWVESRTLTGN
ncbi:BppU family phage baseplate upper protein [Peribacillus frigoritolerans]|uniref:BppU family phage baseplate upper protein n=1 Tax=Peribacillus frigoritolerans TaxID=450367 RepID=UPI002079815E|nr:BppU family phage baseplate upper protein [Peribacillus frigoritolerans]USK66312.1 phage baseplate upper protein [Peribacillus frigoritolerans]